MRREESCASTGREKFPNASFRLPKRTTFPSRAAAIRGLTFRGMKTIRTFSNLADAGFASSLLEAAGIKALLADEQSFTIGYNLTAMGLRLQVEDADVERAERVLENGPDAPVVEASTSEASADGRNGVPVGLFAAGALALGVLAFAVFQLKERRGKTGVFSHDQTYDYDCNRDGRADLFYVYRNGQILSTKSDRNFDGRVDQWDFFNSDGFPQEGQRDQNFDGQVDEWATYENGNVAGSKSDTDFNGLADYFVTYQNGVPVREDIIPNESGNVARRSVYKDGVVTEEWVDENRDGVFDYKILRDPFGGMSEHIPMERAK